MKACFLRFVMITIGVLLPLYTYAYDVCINGIYYNLRTNNKTAEVAEESYSGEVVIPSVITANAITYNVTSIGDYAFYNCSDLTSVTIPNSVTSIGDFAFYNCSDLTSVTISNNVTSIGFNAFSGCSSLASVNIPNSVTSIDDYAFNNCSGLTSVTIPNSVTIIGRGAFNNTPWFNNQANGLIYINNVAYCYKGTMPSNTSITIQEGTVSISPSAFSGCSGLTSVTIPNSVTTIGSGAFYGCSGLTSVTIPNSVTTIGGGAFDRTAWFNNQADGLIYINKVAYCYKGTMPSNTSITIQEGTVSISPSAFSGCSGLASVTIPNSVTSIGQSTFYYCTGLTSVTIPNSVTTIGTGAFQFCTGLTSVDIPNSVTSIGLHAFSYSTGLTSVTIPNSVTSIGNYAFSGCSKLASVVSDIKEPCVFGNNAFSSIASNCTLTVPYGTKDAYIAKGWTESVFKGGIVEAPISNITFVDATVKALCVANWDTNGDGELSEDEAAAVTTMGSAFSGKDIISFDELQYFTGLSSLPSFRKCNKLTSIVIPEGITTIPIENFEFCSSLANVSMPNSVKIINKQAFKDCTNLDNVIIPDNVTYIGEEAFEGCNLTSVTIPNSVTSIGDGAFSFCSGLTSITIPNSVTSIGIYAFSGCSSLTSITVKEGNNVFDSREGCNAIIKTSSNTLIASCQNTVIPNSVTCISTQAFKYCSGLTSLTIPNSVTSIGSNAFYGCSDLTSVVSKIEEPFSFGSEAFYIISSSCTLTIPAGKKEAYIAAGWTESVFKGGIVEAPAPSPNITFADANVKALCVENWDTNGDGELSEDEAAAVTTLGDVFTDDEDILYFEELRYFTGLTSIGASAFSGCTELDDVILPNNVTSIGTNAFHNCNDLEYITIPNSVTSIGAAAFKGCAWLSSVTIPNSVTSIGASAFYDCNRMTSIISEIEEPFVFGTNAFNNLSSNCLLIVPSGTKDTYIAKGWTENIFKGGIVEMELPSPIITFEDSKVKAMCFSGVWDSNGDGELSKAEAAVVTSVNNVFRQKGNITSFNEFKYFTRLIKIEEGTFMNDEALTSITLPNGVTRIDRSAFSGCTGLTSLTIPNAVTSIGAQSFFGCSGLTSIIIPKSVTSIGNAAFQGCNNLSSVVSEIEEPFTIQNSHFSDISSNCKLIVPSGTKDAYIAAGWTEDVFKGGIIEVSNSNIEFSDANVKALCVENWDTNGDGELSEDEAATVTNLGTVFRTNKEITSFNELQYFTGLTSISNGAFSGCSNLISVIMPDGIETIGDYAFFSCKGLNSLALPNSVTSIGNYAFEECHSLQTLVIPASVTSIGVSAFGYCDGLTSIKVEEDNLIYDSRDNCNAIIQKDKNILITGCLNTNIPTTVRSIGQCAFRGCSGLTSVNIPSNIIEIGGSAFMGCANLETLMLPATISSIGGYAFWDCNNLVSVVSERVNPIVLNSMSPTFTSSYNRRVLTIPYGTKNAYIAAGWTEDVFKGGIVEAAPDPSQLNTLAIADTEVLKGRKIILPVNMNNTENITALQFEMTLPAGVSIAKNGQGKYIVEKTGRCVDHTLNVSKPGDANVYKVLLYITPVENITGSEGAVLNVTLETSESMTEGDYEVTISNINLTTPDETKITPADVTCKLTVNNSNPGDANGDGSIDVTDIVSIANAILGRPSSSFDATAADVNGDGSIDVTDIVVIANMILRGNGQNNAKMRGGDEDDEEEILDPQ